MKKLRTILMVSTLCIISTFSAFAGALPTSEDIERWESEYCYPIAQCEGKTSRALTLVGSDVKKYYSGFGAYGYVWGYTDVKNGSEDAYHYTRVEAQESGQTIASQKEYGYGYVEAQTEDIEDAIHRTITARVYWGEK